MPQGWQSSICPGWPVVAGGIDEALCGNPELCQAWWITFFLWQLVFLIKPTPSASFYVSGKGKKLGNFSFMNVAV